MAVISCDITRDGIRINETKSWSQTYTATFQIELDEPMGPIAVQEAARDSSVTPYPVPSKGDYFDYYLTLSELDLSSFALDFVWRRDPQNNLRWFCDVTWKPLDLASTDTIDNITQPVPTLRSAVMWWEFEETTEIVREAKNITDLTHLQDIESGDARPVGTLGALVNAAGDVFDTLPERPKSRPTLVIQRNYSTLAKVRELHDTYFGKLNSDTFQGAAVKTLYVRRISCSQPITENGYTYYQGQIHLAYDPDTWKFRLLNTGLRVRDANGNLVPVNSKGMPITSPILLSVTGLEAIPGTDNSVEYEYADTVSFANILEET